MGKKAGQKPTSRASRQQLLLEFDFQRQAQDEGKTTYQYFLSEAYPPCSKTISELDSIIISELLLDTHHLGRVLFVRTLDTAIRDAAVQNIVQDETGAAERLALYNADAAAKAEDLLPEDALLAIKEPYYIANPNGSYSIRVDHPSDLIRLSPLDPRLPRDLCADLSNISKTVLNYKDEGNAAYNAGNYLSAIEAYSQGLETCGSDDTTIKFDLLRNRAIVNLSLKRFRPALADAKAAVIPSEVSEDDGAIALNAKAYERAGRAAYELGQLQEAESCFKKMQESAPGNESASSALKRIEERLLERSTGDYDFTRMSRSTNKKQNRLDHADFTSNTAIREAGTHGNGLFATENTAAGQLILCEKAVSVAFESDETSQSYTILDPKTQRASTGTQAILHFSLVQKLLHDPELAANFFELFDGGSYPKTLPQSVDGLAPIDAFRTLAIILHNSYGCPTVRSSSKSAQKQSSSAAGYHSTGLWLRASYINHACNGNAMRSFIGDMMIVRATRDIAKGEEILQPYRLPNAVNTVTQEELQKVWGFKCDCVICTTEAETPSSQRRHRAKLIEKARDLSSTPPQHSKAGIAQIEQLFTKLKNAYDERSFKNKPRLGLVAPGLWLCQAYKNSGSQDKIISTTMTLLRDLGFIVTIAGQAVRIDRTYCLLEGTAIEAAMYAAHAFRSRGDTAIGNQMEEFAKSLYVIFHGEARDFEDRYKES